MKSITKWWGLHFLHLELIFVIVLTILITCLLEFGGYRDFLYEILDGNRSAMYGTLATIFGSLLGFTITAASVVMALFGTPRLKLVRESKHSDYLRVIFVAAIRTLGIGTIIALIGLLLDRDSAPMVMITYLLLFVFILTWFRVGRVIWVLEKTLKVVIRN